MDEAELNKIVDAWLREWETGSKKKTTSPKSLVELENEKSWDDPEDTVFNWWMDGEFELLWQFILLAYKREMSDRVFADLAAGPLEDLIADAGPAFIDRIETESRQNPKFRHLLGGVWRDSSNPDIWARIENIRGETW